MSFVGFDAVFEVDGRLIRFEDIELRGEVITEVDGYRLKIEPLSNIHFRLHMRRNDKMTMEVKRVIYRFSLPMLNFGKVLVPDCGRYFMHFFYPSSVWFQRFKMNSVSLGNPLMVLMDLADRPIVAIGTLGKLMETEFVMTSPSVNRKNSFKLSDRFKFEIIKPGEEAGTVVGRTAEFVDGIFIDEGREPTWWHELKLYAELYRKFNGIEGPYFTERAFYPAFCSWLSINSDDMTHEWVIRMGRKVKELGIKAFILDDGWYGVGLDSDNPKIDIGDWPRKVEGKFQDISLTLKELRDMGLNPILWFCPVCVGPDAASFEKLKPYLVMHEGRLYRCPANFYTLCIRNPEARKIILSHIERLLDYGAGGLKLDLFDYISPYPCQADHKHDVDSIADALELLLREIMELARGKDRDMMLSISNNQGNVHLSQFVSCVRGGDSVFDPNILMLRTIYPAAYVPAPHNDYALWNRFESTLGIAHIMLRQIFAGVPNFSTNFMEMSEQQNLVVRRWLELYHELLELYKHGEFEPLNPSLTVWERRLGEVKMLTVLSSVSHLEFERNFTKIYILNGTSSEKFYLDPPLDGHFKVTVYDHMLERTDEFETDGLRQVPLKEAGVTVIET